ncbi:NUDIX domain-containing protein [uncultured Ferrovibrio sp.]|jgi:ADP-ribose pyrophosphatase|uniref:NUDIX domain-containing protein n=1 Tax=uncultured Ferrovibrio sp. TaxID=1576913 RepID=UPI00260D2AA8|nr:NUDIX domain-containing protein [uncultured Ferrovibrio sp.]
MRQPVNTKLQPMPVELIRQEGVFRGHLKVDELILRHGLYAGGMSDEISREVIWRRDAVTVIPYDPKRDEVVLIEQFRASALFNNDPAWMVEIVAGLIEDGEDIEDVCRRELKEESGLEAIGPLIPINMVYSTPGFCSERFYMYCAQVDASQANGVYGLKDEHEDIRVFALPFQEAFAQWEAGKMPNSPATIGLLWLAVYRDRLRQRWEDPRGLRP